MNNENVLILDTVSNLVFKCLAIFSYFKCAICRVVSSIISSFWPLQMFSLNYYHLDEYIIQSPIHSIILLSMYAPTEFNGSHFWCIFLPFFLKELMWMKLFGNFIFFFRFKWIQKLKQIIYRTKTVIERNLDRKQISTLL